GAFGAHRAATGGVATSPHPRRRVRPGHRPEPTGDLRRVAELATGAVGAGLALHPGRGGSGRLAPGARLTRGAGVGRTVGGRFPSDGGATPVAGFPFPAVRRQGAAEPAPVTVDVHVQRVERGPAGV